MKTYTIFGSFLIILLLFSCKSQLKAQNIVDIKRCILELELKSLKEIGQDSVFIKYGLNNLLNEFVEKNALLGGEDLEFHDYRKYMDIKEHKNIFNKEEIKNLYNQLNTSNGNIIYSIELPDNHRFSYAPIEKVKSNFRIGVPLSIDIYSYILSEPLVTSDKKYVLLACSKGFANAKTGGVKIYKKINGDYSFMCLLEDWIE